MNQYYTPTKKQAAFIMDLRKTAAEKIAAAVEFARKRLEEDGKPGHAERILLAVMRLREAIERDETSVEGGFPEIWIPRVLAVINDRWLECINR